MIHSKNGCFMLFYVGLQIWIDMITPSSRSMMVNRGPKHPLVAKGLADQPVSSRFSSGCLEQPIVKTWPHWGWRTLTQNWWHSILQIINLKPIPFLWLILDICPLQHLMFFLFFFFEGQKPQVLTSGLSHSGGKNGASLRVFRMDDGEAQVYCCGFVALYCNRLKHPETSQIQSLGFRIWPLNII